MHDLHGNRAHDDFTVAHTAPGSSPDIQLVGASSHHNLRTHRSATYKIAQVGRERPSVFKLGCGNPKVLMRWSCPIKIVNQPR